MAIARSAATTIPHTTKPPFAITIPPTNHGRAVTGRNIVLTAARISVPAQATARLIPHGAAVIGMIIAAIAVSSWIPAQAIVTATEGGNITTAPATAAQGLVPPAAQRPIPTAITPQAQNIRRAAALNTATGSIAPLARRMSALSATQAIRSLMAVGRITPVHSTGG